MPESTEGTSTENPEDHVCGPGCETNDETQGQMRSLMLSFLIDSALKTPWVMVQMKAEEGQSFIKIHMSNRIPDGKENMARVALILMDAVSSIGEGLKMEPEEWVAYLTEVQNSIVAELEKQEAASKN